MRRPRRYYEVPEVPNIRTPINPKRGPFSIVIPLARTNLVTNPSLETDTTGWLASGGSIARTADEQYHGAYSLAVTPTAGITDGASYGTVSLTAGVTYVASCKFKGKAGVRYRINFATTGAAALSSYRFTATGRWTWIWVFYTETSSTTRRIFVGKDGVAPNASTAIFYVDGMQLESCSDGILVPTTYIDGDQLGLLPRQFPAPYRWDGTPHASTSTRDATTRAGGYVMNLDRYFFRALACVGLGLSAVVNVATTGAGSDGASYQSTTVQSRQFSIQGVFEASTLPQLQRQRADLYGAIGPDNAIPRQPLTLLYQPFDCEREIGHMGRIIASYQSGLEGKLNGLPREETIITFTQWLPAILGGDDGTALTAQSTFTANNIAYRSPSGAWSALGTGMNNPVHALARAPDGTIYAGGQFTTAGGVTVNGVAKWTPSTSTWSALGGTPGVAGGTATIWALAVAPNGELYAGGNFTSAGATGADYIARWDGTNWAVVGSATAINNTVSALVFGPDGNLYVGGDFTNASGIANADYVAKWDGSAWSALGTGMNAGVAALVFGPGGTLYAGGAFTTAGGTAASEVAAWNGSAWSALGGGISGGGGLVYSLAIGPDGSLYAAGIFTTAGGISVVNIAKWNGTGWTGLGSGLGTSIYEIAIDTSGMLYAVGEFLSAGGVSLPDPFARWNGSAWIPGDIDLPSTPFVWTVLPTPDGGLYLGFGSSGTATAAAITTVTNTGPARTYPTVKITGPSSGTARLYQFTNNTTGAALFLNYTIIAGETLTITTSPQGTTLTSDLFGNQSSATLPGSSPDFALAKGANSISLFSSSSTVTALMHWPLMYQSADDLID